MKRTFKSLLAAAGLVFIGLGFTSPARAALTVTPVQLGAPGHEITCYARWGDVPANWPDDGTSPTNSHYIYCGEAIASLPANPTQAQLLSLGLTAKNALTVLPTHVKTLLQSQFVTLIIYKDVNQDFASKNLPVPPAIQNLSAFSKVSPFPPSTTIYEKSRTGVVNDVTFNTRHEMGHHYQHFKAPGNLANSATYKALVARDLEYMDIRTPGNTYRTTHSYFLTDYVSGPSEGRSGYEELFAEQFALAPNLPGTSLPTNIRPFDPISRDNFMCSQAYVTAHRERGVDPVKADFDRYNTPADPDVNYRCNIYRKPLVPAGCSLFTQTSTFPYPYHPGTGNYVYCGTTPATYRFPAGDYLKDRLPNATGSSFLRDKFQNSNITLYVFTSAADAQAKLGAANIPAAALQPGSLGWTQTNPQPIGGQTPNKFIAVWEKWIPWGSTTALVPVETTVATDGTPNRFRSAVGQQAGRMTDYLSGSLNSTTALSQRAVFATAFTKDRTAFDAKATCTIFPSHVCVGGVVQSPYTGKTNWEILTTLYPDLAGTASINTNQYLFAEQVPIIVFSTSGTANGGTRKPMDDRLFHFNKCTQLYTDKMYKFWRLPNATELSNASCN